MFRSSATCSEGLPCVILLLAGSLLCNPALSRAGDLPPRQQPPGVHSTICTSDGYVRDDELALHVANQIVANGGQVQDVKIFLNTCYGGGFLTEFTYIFGASGPCPGVPWVFGSAAEWYEQAWAFRAEWCSDPNSNLGSKFTSALAGPHSGHWDPTPGAMRDLSSHNVQADLITARQHDEAGPNHERWEATVIAVGNGGESLTWNPGGTSHEVILFGGIMNQPAYYNDMENMQSALQNLYGGAPCNIQTIPDGTRQDLLDGISTACANLDANTQLLLHFTDHGGFTCDIVERLQWQGEQPPYTIPQFKDTVIWLPPLPWPPWPKRPPPPPPDDEPKLYLVLLYIIYSQEWIICLNDLPIPLPPGPLVGELELPVAWESLREGENHLTVSAVGEPSGPFVFDTMELLSGPVAMATDPVPEAAVSVALGYEFTAPWFPGSANPFQVPPQVNLPAWEQNGPLTYYYSEPRWPDQQGFWGVSGPQQTAVLTARLFNTYSPAEKQQVVITADIMTDDPTGNAWNVVVQPPSGDELTPPAAHQPQTVHATANPDGSIKYTWEQDITPLVQFEDIAITLKTGTSGDAYIFIDNLTIDTVGQPKDKPLQEPNVPPEQQDKSQSQYYYFSSPEWPPAPHYDVLPTWHGGTLWDRFGSYPPEWLAEVTDHHGAIGLPGGFPSDGQLMVHFDDQAEPGGREHVSYQFDYYTGGGGLWWEPVVPPESLIENTHEEIEELEDGWLRVHLTFDVLPPPAWQEFHWFLSASESSGPVAIDNFAMSSSTWWADYWHDAFDFYEVGLGLHGQYGWKGWDGNPLVDGFVADAQARTLFNSLRVEGPTDLIQELDLPAARYVFTTWQYVPADFQSGCDPTGEFCGSYFILLNTYQDGGPYHWSVQLHADSLTGSFIRDQQTPASLPLITDRWVRIDVLIDLTADLYRTYYDGIELGTAASWTAGVFGSGGGALAIGALDLFANASTTVYYDDIYLRLLIPGDLNCDGIVDLDDFLIFTACMTGPEIGIVPECSCADLDADGDADIVDFAAFQRAFTGS
ncbi:MAG TPA: hypothetical protein PKK06_07710 [Phycisphaerae bacterium]|nr:hypothetical protein [Phycisphaerae bacterium]HNU46078.1 hypothetical protein [Phycisphaerae bacterium]